MPAGNMPRPRQSLLPSRGVPRIIRRRSALLLLPALVRTVQVPARPARVQPNGLPAPAAHRRSPPTPGHGRRLRPERARESERMASGASGIPPAVPAEVSGGRREESAATGTARPAAAAEESCQEQRSFGPKALCWRGLADGPRRGRSWKEQRSCLPVLYFSTSCGWAEARPPILQRTTYW